MLRGEDTIEARAAAQNVADALSLAAKFLTDNKWE